MKPKIGRPRLAPDVKFQQKTLTMPPAVCQMVEAYSKEHDVTFSQAATTLIRSSTVVDRVDTSMRKLATG